LITWRVICRIQDLSFEVGHLHTNLKRKEYEWEGREKNYKHEIDDLEFKASIKRHVFPQDETINP